jgi:hypothetical protein
MRGDAAERGDWDVKCQLVVGLGARSGVRVASALPLITDSAQTLRSGPIADIAAFSGPGALGDDVDDLERHQYFAGLVEYRDEQGDRAATGL